MQSPWFSVESGYDLRNVAVGDGHCVGEGECLSSLDGQKSLILNPR